MEDDMGIERNEAGWGHTRATRAKRLREIAEKATETLCADGAADRVAGVVFVALVAGQRAGDDMHAVQGVIAYGRPAFASLVRVVDEALMQVGGGIEQAEEARREATVKGRRKARLQ